MARDLHHKLGMMPISKVTDLTYERPLIGRMLGYGTLVIESAGQIQALNRIDYLPAAGGGLRGDLRAGVRREAQGPTRALSGQPRQAPLAAADRRPASVSPSDGPADGRCASTCTPTRPARTAPTRPAELMAAAAAAGAGRGGDHRPRHDAGWAAAASARPAGLRLVRGAELSCVSPDGRGGGLSVHLLGYLFDPDHPAIVRRAAQAPRGAPGAAGADGRADGRRRLPGRRRRGARRPCPDAAPGGRTWPGR